MGGVGDAQRRARIGRAWGDDGGELLHGVERGLGVVGGPVAYAIAAHAWHAVELREPAWLAYAALALAWGVLTPLLLQVARRLEAVNSTPGVTR